MFDSISSRYDLLNRLLSFWQDVLWRRSAAAQACALGARRVLDVATGTGDLALELSRRMGPGACVVGLDFAFGMMDVAKRKLNRRGAAGRPGGSVRLACANALFLPFADGSFDAAATAFAARNVADLHRYFAEMRRVVRPGGRVVCLELSHPRGRLWRRLYEFYFYRIVPRLGRWIIGRSGPYDYLPGSLTAFPDQDRLASIMEKAGLVSVRFKNLLGGIAAIHVGQVPPGRSEGEFGARLGQENGRGQWLRDSAGKSLQR